MMMLEWVMAVTVASLLGSAHCVGMCGPFAILAASGRTTAGTTLGASAGTTSGITAGTGASPRWRNITSYHLGRLTTYLMIGGLMGAIGGITDGLAVSAGWTPVAARVVGGVMIAMGVLQLVRIVRGGKLPVRHSKLWGAWSQVLIKVRKRLQFRSATGAAFSWGLISTWLPCGWLYVFAIAAAGTGGVLTGMILMSAFWVGTLPLLSLLAIGATLAGARVQPLVQILTACLLIGFGIFTATSRAEIDLSRLRGPDMGRSESQTGLGGMDHDSLQQVIEQKLPCCENDEPEPPVEDE